MRPDPKSGGIGRANAGGLPVNRSHVVIAVAMLVIGIPAATVISKLGSEGVSDSASVVAHARSAGARLAEPGQPDVYKHRLGIFTSSNGAAQGRLRVRDALCGDLADAGPGFVSELAQCRTREGDAFAGVRYCDVGQVVRGFYGELSARDRDRDRLLAAVDTGPPNIILEVGAPGDVLANIAARGFTRCVSP
jgi:hypothetical protein